MMKQLRSKQEISRSQWDDKEARKRIKDQMMHEMVLLIDGEIDLEKTEIGRQDFVEVSLMYHIMQDIEFRDFVNQVRTIVDSDIPVYNRYINLLSVIEKQFSIKSFLQE